MRSIGVFAVAVVLSGALAAQEAKPVPKDSMRVSIPGCAKGAIFTAGPRTSDQPGSFEIKEGMHLRMNGPKKVMTEIKAHQGAMIEITGLMKKGQFRPDGINLGGGVRVTPGPTTTTGSVAFGAPATQVMIDVEGWRAIVGNCPS